MNKLGCYEISLGDTIGVGTPGSMRKLMEEVVKAIPSEKLAIHCHDTFGQALANVLTVMEVVNVQNRCMTISFNISIYKNFCAYSMGLL